MSVVERSKTVSQLATQARAYPLDTTPFLSVEHDSDVMVTPDRDDGDMSDWAFVCLLEYPNLLARVHAQRCGILGHHEGNIIISFTDGQCFVAVMSHRNSGVATDETLGMYRHITENCRPIPVEMAMRIHPQAFHTLRFVALQAIQYDDNPEQMREEVSFILELTESIPEKATFGDGTSLPE